MSTLQLHGITAIKIVRRPFDNGKRYTFDLLFTTARDENFVVHAFPAYEFTGPIGLDPVQVEVEFSVNLQPEESNV